MAIRGVYYRGLQLDNLPLSIWIYRRPYAGTDARMPATQAHLDWSLAWWSGWNETAPTPVEADRLHREHCPNDRTARASLREAFVAILCTSHKNLDSSSSQSVASGNKSFRSQVSATEITGIEEPDARIKQVRRSLSFAGIEWHNRIRSGSTAPNRSTASFKDDD